MTEYEHCYQDHPFAVEFYDHLWTDERMHDVPFWVEEARKSGGPVLELGCGTGRVLLPIAREGIEVVGLDTAARMLSVCRTKLDAEPPEVRGRVALTEASMHNFRIDRRFAMVYSAFRSFQILTTVEHQLACLACVRDHLKPGGRVILDLFDPYLPFLVDEKRKNEFGTEEPVVLPDGRKVTVAYRNRQTDPVTQTIECENIHYFEYPDGRRERLVQDYRLRWTYRYELEHLFARSGFSIETVYGDFNKGPYGAKQPGEIIMVGKKV